MACYVTLILFFNLCSFLVFKWICLFWFWDCDFPFKFTSNFTNSNKLSLFSLNTITKLNTYYRKTGRHYGFANYFNISCLMYVVYIFFFLSSFRLLIQFSEKKKQNDFSLSSEQISRKTSQHTHYTKMDFLSLLVHFFPEIFHQLNIYFHPVQFYYDYRRIHVYCVLFSFIGIKYDYCDVDH